MHFSIERKKMVGGQNSIFQYRQHKYKRWICNITASQKWKSKFPYHIFNIKDPRYDISKHQKTKQNVYWYFHTIIISFKHEIVILVLNWQLQKQPWEVSESLSVKDETKDVYYFICNNSKFIVILTLR